MTLFDGRGVTGWLSVLLLATLAGCANPINQAPVEDRSTGRVAHRVETSKPTLPPVEAKPGTYIVKPGDTLMRIALENGQAWRDLARWNNLDNPNVLEVGQVLRVVPPGAEVGGAAVATKPISSSKVEAKPLDGRPVAASAPASSSSAATGAASGAPAGSAAGPVSAASKASEPDDDIHWMWPASGPLLGGFDENRNKGLSIGGKLGDPVYASADGRVVYAGNGLRGYGNLIIIKHNANFLTAYAHNQTLLVKEDQTVRRGQKIAEMGSSESDKVQLHFEIRKQGKPIDPAKLLPTR